MLPEQPRTSFVVIPPPDCQPTSIPGISAPVPVRLERASPESELGQAAVKHRSLARLYRELYRMLAGHRMALALALAGLSIATVMKLIPPAATKAMIDYVVMARPLPDSSPPGSPSRSRNPPSSVWSVWSAWSCWFRSWASSLD